MRWNLFRRAETVDATDSSFETTVVDDAAAARMAQGQSPDGVVGRAALRKASGRRVVDDGRLEIGVGGVRRFRAPERIPSHGRKLTDGQPGQMAE